MKKLSTKKTGEEEEDAFNQLVRCMKDHKNDWAIQLVQESNKYCLTQAAIAQRYIQMIGTPPDHTQVPNEYLRQIYLQRKLCPTPCRLLVVNRRDFGSALDFAYRNLNGDNFMVSLKGLFVYKIFYIQTLQAKYGKP